MKILFLGNPPSYLLKAFKNNGDELIVTEKPLLLEFEELDDVDFIISYGYRYIISKEIVERFYRRAINLHISYLPWNRGADPNLWSFIDDTPKGITIHYIDAGLDTGDIIVQKLVDYESADTLNTSYQRLKIEIEKLLIEWWPKIKQGNVFPISQVANAGTYHRSKDKNELERALLTEGWDTPVVDIIKNKDKLRINSDE